MMAYALDNNDAFIINNNTDLCIKKTFKNNQRQLQPSSLVSNLVFIFLITINYYNLSKQEALDAIAYILYEHDEQIHVQLLDCFIQHKILQKPFEEANYYTLKQRSVTGVFLPLTKCYSPLCQPKRTCYSPSCPNKRISSFSVVGTESPEQRENNDWINKIPQHIRNSIDHKELKRQAGIAELILTEKNYCQDLDVLHRIYAIPLLESNTIIGNPSRRQRFYNNVFGNYLDISHLHNSFYRLLTCHNRQSSYFIGRVGTLILQHVTNLIEPYIQYASNHVKAIYCMTMEHQCNPHFAKFLTAQDGLKCTRRLGLRHYLSSPTLKIGKLKLLIQAILKNTVDDADQLSLNASLAILHDTLCHMNSSTKLSPQDLRLEELSTSIYTPLNNELLYIPETSTLIHEGEIWLARSTHPLQPSLCHVFLFSHALILTHPRMTSGKVEYVVIHNSPIPIPFISIHTSTTGSMIRRLSFASTSMVSTPMHLINNLRRQKSINSDSSTSTTETGTTLTRSNTTIHVAHPNASTTKTSSVTRHTTSDAIKPTLKRSPSKLYQIKHRLSKLRTRFSASVPATITRRNSTPVLSRSYSDTQAASLQQRRSTLSISHMAYPDNVFKLEFLERADRCKWENLLQNVISKDKKELFHLKRHPLAFNTTQIGRIRCAFAFVYQGKHRVALGAQSGVWLGSLGGPFHLALPNQDVHQLDVLGDTLIVMRQENKHHLLIAYSLPSILSKQGDLGWCIIKRSSVLCFTLGTIRNQKVIVYLTKRLGGTFLVIIVPNAERTGHNWFKKYKVEYKVTVKDVTDIQIIKDSVYLRSDKFGIERIDVEPQTTTHWAYQHNSVGLLSHGNGFVCDAHRVYSIALNEDTGAKLERLKFESHVNHVAMVYPYLVAFSTSVIEIRNIETTELIQVIRGHGIQYLSNTNDITQPMLFTMSNEEGSLSIHQLLLK